MIPQWRPTRNPDISRFNALSNALVVLRVPALVSLTYGMLRTNADPDLWGHVRFGLDMLSTRALTRSDPYSYTSDIPWLNHEWLSELIMGLAYRTFGSGGLVALCRILNASAVYRWSLPLIFALWVNFHGGWIVGAGILVLWSALEVVGVATTRPSPWISFGVPLLCAGATLANPYGVNAWVFIATTVRLSRPGIVEWQPLWQQPVGALLWLLTLSWVALAVRRARVLRPEAIATVACLAFASLCVLRLLPLFVAVSIVLLLPYVQSL